MITNCRPPRKYGSTRIARAKRPYFRIQVRVRPSGDRVSAINSDGTNARNHEYRLQKPKIQNRPHMIFCPQVLSCLRVQDLRAEKKKASVC
jgi:hypothetical protein